jgi:hypothetical protein
MFSFHRAKVKQDIYRQSSFQNNVLLVCINFVERKNIEWAIINFDIHYSYISERHGWCYRLFTQC